MSIWTLNVAHEHTTVIPKVSCLNILDNNIFHKLYISETYVLGWEADAIRKGKEGLGHLIISQTLFWFSRNMPVN